MLFLEEKTNQKSQTNMDYDDDDRFLLFCFFRENGILKLQPEKIHNTISPIHDDFSKVDVWQHFYWLNKLPKNPQI